MANPNFQGIYSTNNIWRDLDDTICLEDDLDAIEADIAELQTDKADTDHTHTGYATTDHTHSEYAPTSHTHSYTSLTNKPTIPTIPTSLPANGGNSDTVDGKHASDFADASHTHSYAPAVHNHSEHSGDITIIKANGPGITLQSTHESGVKGRIHKNCSATADYGTVISDYDSTGKRDYLVIRRSSPSIGNKLLLNVEDPDGGATKTYQIYGDHNKPGILWSGALYMNANQVVTPSKPLSECRTGWMLLWSDYDPDNSVAKDEDFVTTFIPRLSPNGSAWNGQSYYFDIPRYIGSNTSDVTTEARIIKRLYVADETLTGYSANNAGTRTDVVLRAVYEF